MEYINDFRPEFCSAQYSFTKNFSADNYPSQKLHKNRNDDDEVTGERELENIRKSVVALRDDK